MENISFIEEPLDGSLRGTAYVYLPQKSANKISVKTYPDRIKIAPGDEECSFEAFNRFIQEWEKMFVSYSFLVD